MLANALYHRIIALSLGGFVIFFLFKYTLHAESSYSATIQILQNLYNDEVQAFHNYRAYAQKANSDNHPNIAKLFIAFATSESIHARNFETILSDLGVKPRKQPQPKVEASSTQDNLNRATKLELEEIDQKYPQFVEMLKSENHETAIKFTTYAWESEKQHRDLIQRIKSGTGIFFSFLTKEFQESPTDYFVCQNCGSTLTEVPTATCPICGKPASGYKKIETNN